MLDEQVLQSFNIIQSNLVEHPQFAGSAVRKLAAELRILKRDSTNIEWDSIIEIGRKHPLRNVLHQDPLSHRAFSRPRGYQGDAELLDVVYKRDYSIVTHTDVSELGKNIFAYTIDCKAPEAVRQRRELLAKTIDEKAAEITKPHILSVACGHLREAAISQAVREKNIGRFVGLDQDPASLDLVSRELKECNIETINGSIKLLLAGPLTDERFDLIYAAGLFDYLEDRLASKLTEKMFDMLKPGGTLLIGNFLPDIEDVGYMETYMDWRLIYRTLDDIRNLANGIDPKQYQTSKIFSDSISNVGYLQITR